ncbi:MAG: PEGA domain-containing protein [Chthoniobacteraceae bacterium]
MANDHECRFLIPDHEMLRVIGRGAYGEIWMARSLTGALRAVKLVQRDDFESERAFQREFEGMSAFEPISRAHDGFVDILHVGRGTGFFYYIMELADDVASGPDIDIARYEPKTLRSELQRRKRIPAQECLELALSLTGALSALHAHELAHRDIKPANLIFVRGVPKLADIGLVASSGQKSFVGTEGYVPPEGPGTAQADVYSLGKVLYELSMGKDRLEFPEVPTRLDELADKEQLIGLNEILLKACAGNCASRYKCAETMRRDLLRLQSGKKRAANRWLIAGGLALLAGTIFAASRVDWTGVGTARADAPATLSVATQPPGALVVLDDRLHNSPATFDQLPPGHHTLHVMLKGYEPLDRQFDLAAGATLNLGHLALTPSRGGFSLTTTPAGAAFSLKQGGRTIRHGRTPVTLTDLPVGTYEFSATTNRLTLGDSVEILRNETAARTLDFGPGSGTVKITSAPGGASILQDGKEIGHTPWVIEEVPPGEVSYEVRLEGYKPARLEGGVQSGQRLFLAARLERSLAPVPGQPWTNSLGMRFVPMNDVRFCVWDTRVKDYGQFCTATGRTAPAPDFTQTPEDPVVLVNWQDAMDFCRWLTEKERAARAARRAPGLSAADRSGMEHGGWHARRGRGDPGISRWQAARAFPVGQDVAAARAQRQLRRPEPGEERRAVHRRLCGWLCADFPGGELPRQCARALRCGRQRVGVVPRRLQGRERSARLGRTARGLVGDQQAERGGIRLPQRGGSRGSGCDLRLPLCAGGG